jgi:hypothetical protein
MWAELSQLRFASDATFAAMWGAGLLVFAGLAMWAEIRRTRRRHPDRVGFMPWTTIFFVAALLGIALVTMAIKGWGTG